MFNRIRNLFSSNFITILFIFIVSNACNGYGETFSFAIIADPHIDGHSDHKTKLIRAVDWIIRNKNKKDIELVFVVGDIAWGGTRTNRKLKITRDILEHLNHADIPYIPVIGDNEIQRGCEKEFVDTFDKQYQHLSKVLGHWRKAPTPMQGKYLQNFSFDYKGCHFISCDFNSRKPRDESGALHDFEGGSWPWFKNDIETCSKTLKENIVIITHIGIFRTGFGGADQYLFSQDQMNKVKSFLFAYRDYIDSNYVGHIHQNWHAVVWSGLFTTIYHVRTTDETWCCKQWPEAEDKEVTIRLVQVNNNGKKVIYTQHIYNAQ